MLSQVGSRATYPLGAGSARPNPKKGAPDPENPSCIGLTVLRGGLLEWARPWGRVDPSLLNYCNH